MPDPHGIAAELHYRAGQLDAARDRALRAALVADEVARPFEAARAHAVLACIAARQGDVEGCRTHLDALAEGSGTLPGHVEGLRRHAEDLPAARRGD